MKRVCLTVAVAVSLAACSHGAPAINNDASKTLQGSVAQIRASASARDARRVAAELASLRAQVEELRQHNQISAQAAQKILDAATAVDHNLYVITTRTTQSLPRHGNDGDSEGGD